MKNETNSRTISTKMHINITFDNMKLVIDTQKTGIAYNVLF